MNNFDVNLNLYRSFYYVAKYSGFTKASINGLFFKRARIALPRL